MSLFSISGSHAESKPIKLPKLPKLKVVPGTLIVEEDCWKIIGLTLFTIATSWWLLSGIPEQPVDEPVQTEMVAALPVDEEVEIVTIDQTEALAMGIDAVVSSECSGEWVSDTTLIMVANVILNRTADSRYPDTVDQVLCQPYQFSCFSESGMKWVGKAADDAAFRERCMSAAEAAMNGERLLNYGVVYVSSGKQGTVEAQLDGLYFCR